MKQGIVWILLLLLPPAAMAQAIDFLPPGALSASVSSATSQYDSVTHSRTQEQSLLDQRLDQYNIAPNRISGSLSESSQVNNLALQWGFAENWNLRLAQPQITRTRNSDLTLHRANAKAEAFMDRFASQSRSGSGDLSLDLIWRFSYTDFNDLRMVFGYDLGNGDSYWDQPDRLNLGNGGKDGLFEFVWKHYFSANTSGFEGRYGRSFPGLSQVNLDGREQGVAPGGQQSLLLGYEQLWAWGAWGLGVEGKERGETTIGREGLHDEGNQLGYHLRFGLGNLADLEQAPRPALPWDAEFKLEQVFFGINAPQETSLTLRLNLYF